MGNQSSCQSRRMPILLQGVGKDFESDQDVGMFTKLLFVDAEADAPAPADA